MLVMFVAVLIPSGWARAECNNVVLNIAPVAQEKTYWCWAADGQMILKYYGTSVTQCIFVNVAKGTTSCPDEPGTIEEEQTGLRAFNVTSVSFTGYESWSEIKTHICSHAQPIYARWQWNNGQTVGHAVVVVGFWEATGINYVYFNDPADGFQEMFSYEQFVGGSSYDHTWTHTIHNFQKL